MRRHLVVAATLFLAAACPQAASAATIRVTETAESAAFAPANPDGTPQAGSVITSRDNGNDECSLREAIAAANRDETFGGCPAGDAGQQDVIVVPSGTYIAYDHFNITEPVTIRGANIDHVGNSRNRDPESEIRLRYNPFPAAQQALFFVTGSAGGSRFNGLELTGDYDGGFCPPTEQSQCTASAIVQVRPGVSKTQGQATVPGFDLRNSIIQQWTFGLYVSGVEPQIRFNLFRRNDRLPGGLNRGVDVYADFIHPAENPIITDNVFAAPLAYAIVLLGEPPDYTGIVGATIRRNLIHKVDNRSGAMLLFGLRDVVVDDNVLAGDNLSAPFAIWLDRVSNVKIRENSITGFGGALTIIDGYFGPFGVVGVRMNNNRLYGNGAGVQVGPPYAPPSAPLSVDATANWWGANGGPGSTGARPGAANPVNGVRTLDDNGAPVADGPVAGVDTANPLTLTCSMPSNLTVNTPVSLTGSVTGMPAFDRDATQLPWLEAVHEPIMAGGITGVAGNVFGFGKPPVGGSLTGTLVPTAAGSGAGTVAVDSEQAACAFAAAPEDIDVDKTTTTRRAVPGGLVRYRITVHNRGRAPVRRLRVCDRFPRALRFVSAGRHMRRVAGRRLCRTLRRLGAGRSRTLQLTFRVRANTTADIIINDASADTDNSNNTNTGRSRHRRRHGAAVKAIRISRAAACPASVRPIAHAAC